MHILPQPRAESRGPRAFALLASAALLLSACTENTTAPTLSPSIAAAPVMSVIRDPDLFCPFGCDEITAGDSMRYVVAFAGPGGRARYQERAQWSIADSTIATVSATGIVKGVRPGEVEVRATIGTRSASALVTIAPARIARVELVASATELEPRGSLQLKATAIDVQGNPVPGAELYWFAATPSVVTVDADGLATATGPGDGIVMVYAGFGRYDWVSLHVNGTSSAPALPVATIDVGGTQGCSVSPTGAGSCWGWNYWGQLGNGTFGSEFDVYPSPLPVAGAIAFSRISAADFHTCGLDTEGAAHCWGNGWFGQLGSGQTEVVVARPVRVDSKVAFAAISAGGDHSCALGARGTAFCWGMNYYGQLGTGTLENAPSPVALATGERFASVFAGLWHSCALALDGAAWCWGGNDFGQLGNGKLGGASLAPVKVSGRQRFTSMDSRVSHACGITSAGETHCWGRNDFGQLGDGTSEQPTRPVRVLGGVAFTTVATGGHHTCALDAGGAAWCWGNNEWGQLGDNTLNSSNVPVRVHGTQRFQSLTAGNNVTCGTTSAGEAWCWGSSHYGMLGNGQSGWDTVSPVPVKVTALRR